MAITTTHTAPKIVGKALYLELVADPNMDATEQRSILGWQSNGTKQLVIFPQYQDDTGTIHQPVIMERIISSYSPRAQWETTYLDSRRPKPIAEIGDSDSWNGYSKANFYTKDEWAELTAKEQSESFKLALEIQLRNEIIGISRTYNEDTKEHETEPKQGWVVRDSKPISVEITDQDLAELHNQRKTPQAVIRRINKVRDTLDKFPKKLA